MTNAIDPRILAKQVRAGMPERTNRTPYYIVDVPYVAGSNVLRYAFKFRHTMGRDYEGQDPQFWGLDFSGKPVEIPNIKEFIQSLTMGMCRANHHPAHIHAVESTHLFIFGCGSCVDDCTYCNFRYVPEEWTQRWKLAVESSELWSGKLQTPSPAEVAKYAKQYR